MDVHAGRGDFRVPVRKKPLKLNMALNELISVARVLEGDSLGTSATKDLGTKWAHRTSSAVEFLKDSSSYGSIRFSRSPPNWPTTPFPWVVS